MAEIKKWLRKLANANYAVGAVTFCAMSRRGLASTFKNFDSLKI